MTYSAPIQTYGMEVETAPNGVLYARSRQPLGPYPVRLTDRLDHWAHATPTRVFLAERRAATDPWQSITYQDARERARGIAQGLLNRELSASRPIAVLSGNGIEHALLMIGAMYAGIPIASLAPAYSLVDPTFGLLADIWRSLMPGLVFAAEEAPYGPALKAVGAGDVEVLTSASLAALAHTRPNGVDKANARVTADTPAKIMFTSGSTGLPKGVINTHRNLCSNQEQLRSVLRFLADEPPVLCDWLPWNHTFGGNHNLGLVLYNGGSLFIDHGRPVAGPALDLTVANLRDVAPTFYLNVPRGYELLATPLRDDGDFRERFFSRTRALFCAAASIKPRVATDIQILAASARGTAVPWVTGLGATESSPFAICTGQTFEVTQQRIGVPAPGVEMKLVPTDGLLEARLRGPNITPGYWRDDEQTRAAFDEEGYYRLGDAVRFVSEGEPDQGLVFEGRLNENFKLSTGTWVRVGPLRQSLLHAFGDLVRDVVIGAPDRDLLVALVFPNIEACRGVAKVDADVPGAAVLSASPVRAIFSAAMADAPHNQLGATVRISRIGLALSPPSLAAGEITDKGSLNQRAILRERAAFIESLYAAPEGTVLVS